MYTAVANETSLMLQVMDSCPEAGRFVVQAQQLVSDFREEDVAGLSCVLVHGNSLQAYTVIHALQSKGLPAGQLTEVHVAVLSHK